MDSSQVEDIEDKVKEDGIESTPQKKSSKRKFIVRKRVEEDPRLSKQVDLLPKKRSFQQAVRLVSQSQKVSVISPQTKSSVLSEGKGRETMFSSKSAATEQVSQPKMEEKKLPSILDEQLTSDVQGPQIEISKTEVSFMINTGQVAFDYLSIRNNGSASIYYEWKRADGTKVYQTALQDPLRKFFCHHEQSVIKPGESRRFVFAFMSKITGVFQEEWELVCEPPTTRKIPSVHLTGNAIEVDKLKEQRVAFDKETQDHFTRKNMEEIVGDVLDRVKTPKKPLPDLTDPRVCQAEFESKNSSESLWYNPLVMKWWKLLESDLYAKLGKDPVAQRWDLDVSKIYDLIELVEDEDDKYYFEQRYQNYFEFSKAKPIERSDVYSDIKNFVSNLLIGMPVISDKVREQLGMWEGIFSPPPDDRDPTEQEIKQLEDTKNKIKNEWMKKTKKKKWEKEDDTKMLADYNEGLSASVNSQVQTYFTGFEDRDVYLRSIQVINNRRVEPSIEYFEHLLRKKPLREADIDGRRIILKVHLKLSSQEGTLEKLQEHEQRIEKEHFEELKRIEEEKLQQEKLAKEKKKATKKPPPQKKGGKTAEEEEAEAAAALKAQERKLDLSFLDSQNLNEIVDCLKYILERQAKMVILLVSFDKILGEFRLGSSVKFLSEYLRSQLENQITFNEGAMIENFDEKLETESFPDNSILLLENSYFTPEEVGFKQVKSKNEEGEEEYSLVKLNREDKSSYIKELTNYSNLLVIEDKENIFKNMTSLTQCQFDNQVLGLKLTEELQFISHLIAFQKNHFHIFIGGNLTPSKLVAIDTLARFANQIYLFGSIALKFILTKEDSIKIPGGQFTPTEIEQKAIKALLERISNSKAKLILPLDFVIVPNDEIEGVEKLSEKWLEQQIQHAQNFPPKLPPKEEQENDEAQQNELKENVVGGDNQVPADQGKNANQKPTDNNQKKGEQEALKKGSTIEVKEKTKSENVQKEDTEKKVGSQKLVLNEDEEEGNENEEKDENEDNEQTVNEKQDIVEESQKDDKGTLEEEIDQEQFNINLEKEKEINEEEQLNLSEDKPEDKQSLLELEFARKKNMQQQQNESMMEIEEVEEEVNKNEYDNKAPFPENHVIIDYGEQTLELVRKGITKARKLGWFEELSFIKSKFTNSTNILAARTLNKLQEEKKERLEATKKNINSNYSYSKDILAILFGTSLEQHLSMFDLVEVPPQEETEAHGDDQPKPEQDDPEEEEATISHNDEQNQDQNDNKSEAAALIKINTTKVISDFYSNDSDFAFQILQVGHSEALSKVHSYSVKSTSNLSDEFPFLDDL